MIRNILMIIIMINFLSCKTSRDLPTVNVVDINKYAGTWYEIARLPNRFEKGLECVSATYTVRNNGKIDVLNKGYLTEKNHKLKKINGLAWVPSAEYPGRLKVRFFWPFSGNYYIISLDENYSYALVGDPSRKYLWILSKSKNLDNKIYSELLNVAKMNGFNIEKVIKTNQECN
jgi:apolipoprotein D and lipocalin family protein